MARRRLLGSIALALAATLVAVAAPAGAAAPVRPYYLVLGDSVAFGYSPPQVTPNWKYQFPGYFQGYGEYLGNADHLHVVNASCPGETSSSFIDQTAQSNGCENSPGSPVGYRTIHPLHTSYTGSQLDEAVSFLTAHPGTQLVSLNIGANDLFLCQETTPDNCTGSDFQDTIQQIAANVQQILTEIRTTAHYTHKIVIMQYYSTDYSDQITTLGAEALNQTLTQVGTPFGATFADGFNAFRLTAGSQSVCDAGLLIKLPGGTCNIHPSPFGQAILSTAVAAAAGTLGS